MSKFTRPTDAELAILQVLWQSGPSTVRQVYGALGSKGAYTTILTVMQVMTEKGLIAPDKSKTAYVYSVTTAPDYVQEQLVSDLMDRAFSGVAQELVLKALSTKRASKEDLRTIRTLIDKLEKETNE